MANDTKLWVGTDSGNEGDWSVAANWSPVGVPVDDDIVILKGSSQSVTAGLDQSLIDLASLFVDRTYTGNIGSSGSPLLIDCTTNVPGRTIMESGGDECWLNGAFRHFWANPQKSTASACNLSGSLIYLYVMGGRVVLSSSGTITTNCHIVDAQNNAIIPTLTLAAGSTLDTADIYQTGGRVLAYGTLTNTTVYLSGGTFNNYTTISKLTQTGGHYIHQPAAVVGDTRVFGGYFNASLMRGGEDDGLTAGTSLFLAEPATIDWRGFSTEPASWVQIGDPTFIRNRISGL